MGNNLDKIVFTSQKKIKVDGGDIYHVIKKSNFKDFQFKEVYFSFVDYQFVKGWKLHKKMYSNLCVPIGSVEFTFVCKEFRNSKKIILGESNYGVLSVPPNIWFSFKGLDKNNNIILNLSNFEYDINEVKKIKLEEFPIKINI